MAAVTLKPSLAVLKHQRRRLKQEWKKAQSAVTAAIDYRNQVETALTATDQLIRKRQR